MSDWRTVDSVPGNKTVILFAVTERDAETNVIRNWKMKTGFWSKSSGDWHWPNRLSDLDQPPTHWHPLPSAPGDA